MECIEQSKMKLNFVSNKHFDIKRIYKNKRRGFQLDKDDEKFIENNVSGGMTHFPIADDYYGNSEHPYGIYPNNMKSVICFLFDEEILEKIVEKNVVFSGSNGIMRWN
jgi:hypothetical protein